MTDAIVVRDFITDFLKKELVGPFPIPPNVQENGQEILRAQDPPRQRYGAGILFPMRARVSDVEGTAADDTPADDTLDPDASDAFEDVYQTVQDAASSGINDNQTNSDHEVTLANEFLPSAMGLTACVEVSERLCVRIEAGVYTQDDYQWQTAGGDGNGTPTKAWFRSPIDVTVDMSSHELLGPGTMRIEKSVHEQEGEAVLVLHAVSRPYHQPTDGRETRLVTFTLVNRRQRENAAPSNSECFFQCGFTVSTASEEPCFLRYPERPHDHTDSEDLSQQLLHRHRPVFAVGHGCAADWTDADGERSTMIRTEIMPTYDVRPVMPTLIQGLELRMMDLAFGEQSDVLDLCSRLADAYEEWIIEKEGEIDTVPDLSPELRGAANGHMTACRMCLERLRGGIKVLEEDADAASAFRLMNEAMLMQQIHYGISSQQRRDWESVNRRLVLASRFSQPNYDDPTRIWRPFQLAFILMNLRSMAEPDCDERRIVDVIWFPTGGGKTEAYSGLAAFSLFLRRLRNPVDSGTNILMRYTLRLLTTQQFQRAASLMCACEILRRRETDRLGAERFSIGLWVGGEVTPNTEMQARESLAQLQNGQGGNCFVLLSCPWCGAGMGPQGSGRNRPIKGYIRLSHPPRVRHICEDQDCPFSAAPGLPVSIIDEDIYQSPPTLLIGTVDKFAMLAFRPDARRIFGIGTSCSAPELIIQDELHLISGPLGSMVGHYETVIDALCQQQTAKNAIPAKIVASTATIARANSQVMGLYGRDAFVFPPQALRVGDSFFAEERADREGRRYLGVFASGLNSHATAQVRTMASLLQAPMLCKVDDPSSIDPYWTMMGYFNSLRELGQAATFIQADIREYLNAMWDRLGLRRSAIPESASDNRRFIRDYEELTSREQSNRIPGILQRLFSRYPETPGSRPIDVCFATNMIQVGLDVPRLSLMTVVGQPKTTSEYIQASSRVGRDIPGLVVTNYNPSRPRDRSHYEQFRSYHQSIYQHVEPTSVTPFSVPVRERALHALVVILCRYWGGEALLDKPVPPPSDDLILKVKNTILERVGSVDPSEKQRTEQFIDDIFSDWARVLPPRYGSFGTADTDLPLMHPAGWPMPPEWEGWPYSTPTSMRNVDASCSARWLVNAYDGGSSE